MSKTHCFAIHLAEAMLKCWRREAHWKNLEFQLSPLIKQMDPHVAAGNLLKLARFVN